MTKSSLLKWVLPESGYYCGVTIVNNQWRHKFHTSIELLENSLLQQSAQGLNTYYAVASYTVGKMDPHNTPPRDRKLGRTGHNIKLLKTFFMDIDTRESKPKAFYENREEAYHHVIKFCHSTGYPKPIFNSSGFGLHIYWPTVEALTREAWQPCADRLREHAAEFGIHADHNVTINGCAVLRMPGTKNKDRIVECGSLEGPYTLEEMFHARLERTPVSNNARIQQRDTRGTTTTEHVQDTGETGTSPSFITAALALYGPSPSGDEVANHCAQLRKFRETPSELLEPEWYAGIGVLAHCSDGDRLAHEWSSQDTNRYDEGDTEKRLERAREYGPTTCERYSKLNDICRACPLWGKITSPIQARQLHSHTGNGTEGHKDGNVEGRGSDTSGGSVYTNGLDTGIDGAGISASPQLPSGFQWRHQGLYYVTQDRRGQDVETKVSAHPIWLSGVNVGESYVDRYSLTLNFVRPHEGEKQIIIGKKDFHSASGMSELMGKGPVIHDTDLFKKYIREQEDMYHDIAKTQTRYDQMGWKGDDDYSSFLIGNRLYSQDGKITIIQPSESLAGKAREMGLRVGGSLAGWTSAAHDLFGKGFEPHIFALMASFGALFIRMHTKDEGGAIISFVTSTSGAGKSTALNAVASVWGSRNAIELTAISTEIRRVTELAVMCNVPVILDELHFRDDETVREFVRMFTVGKDRGRATRDGELSQSNRRWATTLVTCSNRSATETLSINSPDALSMRVLEFSADNKFTKSSDKGDTMQRNMMRNYGYAGDKFLKAICNPGIIQQIQSALPTLADELNRDCQLEIKHRFWVRQASSCLVAAKIVEASGILEFDYKSLKEWTKNMLVEKRRHGQSIKSNPASVLGAFLSQHALDTITVSGPAARGRGTTVSVIYPERRNLYIRNEVGGRQVYIDRDAFRKWCYENNQNRDELVKELISAGIIVNPEKHISLAAGTGKISASRPAYQINSAHPEMLGEYAENEPLRAQIVVLDSQRDKVPSAKDNLKKYD